MQMNTYGKTINKNKIMLLQVIVNMQVSVSHNSLNNRINNFLIILLLRVLCDTFKQTE